MRLNPSPVQGSKPRYFKMPQNFIPHRLCNKMISRFQINGFRRLFVLESLYQFSTTVASTEQPKNYFLIDYLINSLGLSKSEALSATRKVRLYKSSRNDPNLVISFLGRLGLNRTQVRSIVFANPSLLTYNVDKTLQPKILALEELGLSGSDIVKVLWHYKSFLSVGPIRGPIEYLRSLLGSNENVAQVVRKFCCVLDSSAPRLIESNVQLLKKKGFSGEFVYRLLQENPRRFMQNPKYLEEALYMVENEFGFVRNSKMFYHGVLSISSVSKTKIDMKLRVLRSFGLSDLMIYSMIKKFPCIVKTSEDKMRKVWNFFAKEIGYGPNFFASHPIVFNLSLEKRVIPRYEVLKFLDEKNLIKRKWGLYGVLCMTDSVFVGSFLLPYENEIPDVVESYFKIVRRKKTRTLIGSGL